MKPLPTSMQRTARQGALHGALPAACGPRGARHVERATSSAKHTVVTKHAKSVLKSAPRGLTGAQAQSSSTATSVHTLNGAQHHHDDLFHEPGLMGPACPLHLQTPGCNYANPVCQLDVRSDPVETLQQLRQCLATHNSATLIVLDGRPNLLLDAVSLLHLLNQDLRLEEDFQSMVLFQPILRAEAFYIDGNGHVQNAAASTTCSMDNGTQSSSIYNRLIGSSMALHVTKLRAPGLLQRLPTSVVAYTPPLVRASSSGLGSSTSGRDGYDSRLVLAPISKSSTMSEVWTMTEQIVERLETHVMTQLRCVGPRSLVVAFRAIKRARKLLNLAGNWDLLVAPHIISDKSMVCFNCWRSKSGGLDSVTPSRHG